MKYRLDSSGMILTVAIAMSVWASASSFQCGQTRLSGCRLLPMSMSQDHMGSNSALRNFKGALAAAVIATSTIDSSSLAATAAPPVTVAALEEKIKALEMAESRGDVVQALADVFEAAGSKTLLVRTKYKYRIVNAINEKRIKLGNEWDQALSFESGEVKRRADPYRTVDIGGYLKIAPYIGGAAYLAALFVQQALPELFVFAYPLAVFVFAAPIAFIVLTT
jgi:hypothetical protein